MRLIDADALKAHYAWWGDFPEDGPNRIEEKKIFDTIVDLQPTVDLVPIPRAKWIKTELGNYACSRCGGEPWYCRDIEYKFCPYCGARMEG